MGRKRLQESISMARIFKDIEAKDFVLRSFSPTRCKSFSFRSRIKGFIVFESRYLVPYLWIALSRYSRLRSP